MVASIRSRIVFTLVAALAVAGFVASMATYYSTRLELSTIFDDQLKQTALEIVERHKTDVSDVYVIGQTSQFQVLIQVYDSRNNQLYLSQKRSPLPIAENMGFSTIETAAGDEWRQYVTTVGTQIIQVAQPMSVRSGIAVNASMRILQPTLIMMLFLAIAIWFVIVQALQSLNKTARAVSQRSPAALDPIPTEGLPFEVKSLVSSINRLMERLSDSLSAQQRFASDAAHELRTPLAAITLQAQLLSRAKTPEDKAKYISRLQQGVARATRLVEQLLTIARLDPDSTHRPLQEVNVDSLAHAVVEDLTPVAQAKSITLTARTLPTLAMGLPDALRLMITNLTDNAIRYTPEGGRIEIAVQSVGRTVHIAVTDNGPGIPPDERQRVFERFYRALGTKVSGTGLGLAIVSRIVQMHHGSIHVEDGFPQENGCGASFVVTLPVDAMRAQTSLS
ncbi:MAG: two-component sensor histidine kinase [Duodenibacillus sp.]|nr:two-component sensor histidine kinase [Duodenibacillus sp.]